MKTKRLLASLVFLFCFSYLCAENEEKKNIYRVLRVIDGDTIEIEGRRLVRYIGIDTPELRVRTGTVWKYRPEPYGEEAKKCNEKLVANKEVRLEFDVEVNDRYNRLLAYVYVDDLFVNEEMVKQGYALLLTIPPDVKYVEVFKEALREARENKRGLWKRAV